jgi:hypothetical protein
MSIITLIGINGLIGAGKSTTAEYLLWEYDFVDLMFSQTLKDIAVLLGFERDHVFGTQHEKTIVDKFWNISPREFLEKFGTEVMRQALPNVIPSMDKIWVKIIEKRIKTLIERGRTRIVISDCRNADEMNMIKQLGGYIMKITMDKEDLEYKSNHSSNNEYDDKDCDVVIHNKRSPALFDDVDEFIKKVDHKQYKKRLNNYRCLNIYRIFTLLVLGFALLNCLYKWF